MCKIGTFTGLLVNPLDMRPEDLDIRDIARSLSMRCRFGGHLTKFYSVAQHSVEVSRRVAPQHALWGLLHDASEAYTSDVPSPLKQTEPLTGFRGVESAIMGVVCTTWALTPSMPLEVRKQDLEELVTEASQLHPLYQSRSREGWDLPEVSPRVQTLSPLAPKEAEFQFLKRYEDLTKNALL